MKRQDFYFELPKELIAQTPLKDRSASKLLVYNLKDNSLHHQSFKDIADYFQKGDCLVLNNTKVMPARLMGVTKKTGSPVEVLLLKKIDEFHFEALVKPGKKMKEGAGVVFSENLLEGEVCDITAEGNRIIKFFYDGIFEEILDALGEMPLPPYITEKLSDKSRYQTVYAKHEGSAAAPTAGLHFTEELLKEIADEGVHIANITLHVGLGTFRPVKEDDIFEHIMHSEYYNIEKSQADIINNAKKAGGKIIAVGTTSCRTLEACAAENGLLKESCGNTDIFIYPGYNFKIVDGLVTNFHLPESTLIMLVSAFCGRENILNAYYEAIKNDYRFFSFGDAMLINPIRL